MIVGTAAPNRALSALMLAVGYWQKQECDFIIDKETLSGRAAAYTAPSLVHSLMHTVAGRHRYRVEHQPLVEERQVYYAANWQNDKMRFGHSKSPANQLRTVCGQNTFCLLAVVQQNSQWCHNNIQH